MAEVSRNPNRGEFYTPKHISDLLFDATNKIIPNFNETHLVWDNCWGTGNLTKDREFSKLYCSTIQRMDIRRNKKKNPNAVKFQYDFLNNDTEQLISPQAMWIGETSLPKELDAVLRDKDGGPILFYINPPYVATGIYGTNNTLTKEGQTENQMKEIMREHRMQSACDQAYAQFLYKIMLMREAYENRNISIAVICPPLFLSAQTYQNFRERFLREFKFEYGAIFSANEFQGLSDRWAISVQIYTPGETEDKKNFYFDVLENIDGEMKKTGVKHIYNLDGERICMDWAKDELRAEKNVPARHTLSSGCRVSNKKQVYWEMGSLGYIFYKGNNIYHNEQELGVMSLPYGDGAGYSITKENFDKTMAIFCARRCYSRYGANWINDKDEYCIPDTESDAYKILLENSMIYMLFNGSAHMTSIFIQGEDGRVYEVPNHFHHISLEETKSIFNKYGVDIKGPGELQDRYAAKRVKEAIDSGLVLKEGIDVLEEYYKLWEKTIPIRKEFNQKEPLYQVENWDAGFYQLKWLIKDNDIEDFRRFQLMYRAFEDKVRPLVHECGFLR